MDVDFLQHAQAYEKSPDDFFTAYHYLYWHPAFTRVEKVEGLGVYNEPCFMQQLYVMVVRVDPATEHIDSEHPEKNTATRVWLEAGAWHSDEDLRAIDKHWVGNGKGSFSHDTKLDCGGPTFEAAIIELAALVKKTYGDQRPPLAELNKDV